MSFLAAAMVAGSILGAYGKKQAANAEAGQLFEKADLLGLDISEIQRRHELNVKQIKEDVVNLQGSVKTISASAGTVSEISSLTALAEAGLKAIEIQEEDVKLQTTRMEREMSSLRQAGRRTRRAGTISAVGSILGGAGQALA